MKKTLLTIAVLISTYVNAQKVIKSKSETGIDLMKYEISPDNFGSYDGAIEPVNTYEVWCSSTLPAQGSTTYDAKNLNDAKIETAWAEGDKEYGIGTKIDFKFLKDIDADFTNTMLINGYYKSKISFQDNSRVKKFKLYLNNKEIAIVELNDFRGMQTFSLYDVLPKGKHATSNKLQKDDVLQFEILEIYPGAKYKDVCISEFRLGM
jgi:hypothetical protein